MLQQQKTDDYILRPAKRHSVRELVELAFAAAGWMAVPCRIDPWYFRPTESISLRGEATKAREMLGGNRSHLP